MASKLSKSTVPVPAKKGNEGVMRVESGNIFSSARTTAKMDSPSDSGHIFSENKPNRS